MAQVTLDTVLESVKMLTLDEQRQLREWLDRQKAPLAAQFTENELNQKLLEAGLLSEIHPSATQDMSYQNWKPVKISEKPLSEIIMEERG